jgi:hypothetical protein
MPTVAENYVVFYAINSGHRQDIKVLLTVLNFRLALVHEENYQQIILRTLTSAANF